MFPTPQRLHVVCAILRDREGRILAAQRPTGKALAGKWEFPGGKVEPGELPEAALQRELREELGIETDIGRALSVVSHLSQEVEILLCPYEVSHRSGVIESREHAELRWLDPRGEAWLGLAWAEADLPIEEELRLSQSGVDSFDLSAKEPEPSLRGIPPER
ncbi:MAG TPA: (deoxy)nucleoside triphosphate pyrophosphohydrolase [Verrucomicrobiales bacterium]|nr:(deoxy)nucleoside triphosphate pyrophosphohydrolase [Verrucomicrobiales bacterium]